MRHGQIWLAVTMLSLAGSAAWSVAQPPPAEDAAAEGLGWEPSAMFVRRRVRIEESARLRLAQGLLEFSRRKSGRAEPSK